MSSLIRSVYFRKDPDVSRNHGGRGAPTLPWAGLTKNLGKVYAAVGKVFASADVTGLKLEAVKYYYIPDKELGLSGIVIAIGAG